jgi:aerobic carbon-monoxide dehydrogenase medium subunit
MIPAGFDYSRPTSVDEALGLLASHGGEAKVIAGGQSLIPLLKLRLAHVDRLVDIGRIRELRGMRDLPDGGYEIGALTTYADILATTRLAWVREAVEHIADVQTRYRGTIGGSIAHADPASDAPAIALALDYAVVLRSRRGERVVPLDGFFLGAFHTAMEHDELLVSLRRGPLAEGAGGAFVDLEQPASGYSLVGVAAVVAGHAGAVTHARVAITGVGEVPYRAKAVEAALLAGASPADAAAHATDGVTVNGDIHANPSYRAAMAAVYARRAIETALARAG